MTTEARRLPPASVERKRLEKRRKPDLRTDQKPSVAAELLEFGYNPQEHSPLLTIAGIVDREELPIHVKRQIVALMVADRDPLYVQATTKQLGIDEEKHTFLKVEVRRHFPDENLKELSTAIDRKLFKVNHPHLEEEPTNKKKRTLADEEYEEIKIPERILNNPELMESLQKLSPEDRIVFNLRSLPKPPSYELIAAEIELRTGTVLTAYALQGMIKGLNKKGLVKMRHPGNPGPRKKK